MSEDQKYSRTKKHYIVTNKLDGERQHVVAFTSKTPERVAHDNLSKAIKAKHAVAMKAELETLRSNISVVRVTEDHLQLLGLSAANAIDLTAVEPEEDKAGEAPVEASAEAPVVTDEAPAAEPEEEFEV